MKGGPNRARRPAEWQGSGPKTKGLCRGRDGRMNVGDDWEPGCAKENPRHVQHEKKVSGDGTFPKRKKEKTVKLHKGGG